MSRSLALGLLVVIVATLASGCGSRKFKKAEAPSFTFPQKEVVVTVREIKAKGSSRAVVTLEATNNSDTAVFFPFLGNVGDFSGPRPTNAQEALRINPDARIGPVGMVLGFVNPDSDPHFGTPKQRKSKWDYSGIQRAVHGGYKVAPGKTEEIEVNFNWSRDEVKAREERFYIHVLGLFDEDKKIYGGGFIPVDVSLEDAIRASKSPSIGNFIHKVNPAYR